MKNIYTAAPVQKPKDIPNFVTHCKCRHFYVYYDKFIYENFSKIEDFIKTAKDYNCKIYVNFKHDISEEDIDKIKKFILFLTHTKIDGIFINCFTVLEALKNLNFNFKIIADSFLSIHNTEGIKFINSFRNIDKVVVSEEIYIKNLQTLKKNSKVSLAIDSDNLPWCAEQILQSETIDFIIIKGNFKNSAEILKGIQLAEKILQSPKFYKNKNLPFKNTRNCYYQTNHFSGEIINANGENFEFTKYVEKFKWNYKRQSFLQAEYYKNLKLPDINLRLSSLKQLKAFEKYIKNLGFNPVYSIEFGEIISNLDLYKNSVSDIMNEVNNFCKKYGIILQYSTPGILLERDFERVYNDVKNFCLKEAPGSIIINNTGFFQKFISDRQLSSIPVEIGTGINLLNSLSIRYFDDIKHIHCIDFTTFRDINNIKKCINRLNNLIPRRKLTISGNIPIPTLGLCPLNSNPAFLSRLNCTAPCRNNFYAIFNPYTNKRYPFIPDGFCRMHLFKDEILDLCKYTCIFEEIGINEFVIDMRALDTKYVSVLLNRCLNSLKKTNSMELPILTEHLM